MMQFGNTWKRTEVVKVHDSPRSYVVRDEQNKVYRRNRKLLRPTKCGSDLDSSQTNNSNNTSLVSDAKVSKTKVSDTNQQIPVSPSPLKAKAAMSRVVSPSKPSEAKSKSQTDQFSSPSDGNKVVETSDSVVKTRSGRVVNIPAKYDDYV